MAKSKALVPAVAEKKHAKYAASSAHRWLNCKGSIKRIALAPVPKDSAASLEGTLAHEAMELALKNQVGNVARYFAGDRQYSKEIINGVQDYVTYVRANTHKGDEVVVEEKVYLDFIHPDMFGTVDTAIIEPFGTLESIDFKFGKGFVSHEKNPQLIYYALALAHKYDYDFEEVKTTVIQPRVGNGKPRTYKMSISQLKEWADVFKDAVNAAESASLDDVTAGSWCKFCPAAYNCPAISKGALAEAKVLFDEPVFPDPKTLTSDNLSAIVHKAAYVKLWVSEVEKHAQALLESGHKIKGLRLVPKRPKRVWAGDERTLKEFLLGAKLLHGVSAFEKKIKSPAAYKKELESMGVDKETIETLINRHSALVSSGQKVAVVDEDLFNFDLELDEEIDYEE